MKRGIAFILGTLLVMTLMGCKGGGPVTEDGQKTEEAQILLEENLLVDLTAPLLSEYLEAASGYNTLDYTYTAKTVSDVTEGSGEGRLTWQVTKPEEIKTEKVRITDREGRAQEAFAKKKVREKQSVSFFNLIPDMDYTYQVEVTLKDDRVLREEGTFRTLPGVRIITVDGVKNVRDIGGYRTADGKRVRYGMAYRAAKMNGATPAGVKTVIETLGIRTELDLRNPDSEGDSPVDTAVKGYKDYNYVILSSPHYLSFFTNSEQFETVRKEVLFFTEEKNFPIVFHCKAGADRTGTLSLLILALLGVEENDLMADYELTPNRERMGHEGVDRFYDVPEMMRVLKSFEGNSLKEKAESFVTRKLGIEPEKVEKIRELMLE